MYILNKIGPWPIIDVTAASETRTTGATDLALASGVAPCLELGNIGGTSDCFVTGRYEGTASFSGANKLFSWGVALQPIGNVINSDAPIYIDYSINVGLYLSSDPNVHGFCWVGQESGAGTPTQGFDNTNNLVPDYHLLPLAIDTEGHLQSSGQILIKDINSGGIDRTKINMLGFSFRDSSGSASIAQVIYTISARYSTKSLGTSYAGV